MEGAREIDRQNGVPLLDRKIFNRCDILNSGIVDENVNATEFLLRQRHHRADVIAIGHVGVAVDDLDVMAVGDVLADGFDLVRIAKSIEHDIGAIGGQPARNTKTDSTGRAGHDGGFSRQHVHDQIEEG